MRQPVRPVAQTLHRWLWSWRGPWQRLLRYLGWQQIFCWHHYWPYIRKDGTANIRKCGKCGKQKPQRGVRHA